MGPASVRQTIGAVKRTAAERGGSRRKLPSREARSSRFASRSCTPATTGSGGASCLGGGQNDDMDKDGWTPAQGDCNDCDPNVNPGAIDVGAMPDGDGGMTMPTDNDCDGKIDPPQPCDDALQLASP